MDALDALLEGDPKAWIEALPGYQQTIIQEFLEQQGDPGAAAELWLQASGPSNTFPFGGKKPQEIFYAKLLTEVEDFLCGSDRYGKEREAFLSEFDAKHAYVVGGISTIVAPAVGSAAPIIAPAVALILLTLAKMGRNAWCGMRAELKESQVPVQDDE